MAGNVLRLVHFNIRIGPFRPISRAVERLMAPAASGLQSTINPDKSRSRQRDRERHRPGNRCYFLAPTGVLGPSVFAGAGLLSAVLLSGLASALGWLRPACEGSTLGTSTG